MELEVVNLVGKVIITAECQVCIIHAFWENVRYMYATFFSVNIRKFLGMYWIRFVFVKNT